MDQACCTDQEWKGVWDPFVRLCYQFGMLLGVDEFQQDQGFHLCKHRLSQRLFTGFGLVWGGQVAAAVGVSDGKPFERLTVQPLFALDELGRELWVQNPCTLDLLTWADQNHVTDGEPIYLTVSYQACCVAPVPAVAAPCDDAASPTMPSRALETAALALQTDQVEQPIDLTSQLGPDGKDAQPGNFALLVKLIKDDAARPLLLGALTRSTDGGGHHSWAFTANPDLLAPRIAAAGGTEFHVVSASLGDKVLHVALSLPPAVAPIGAFHVDAIPQPATPGTTVAPVPLVDTTKAPTLVAPDFTRLTVPLTANPDKNTAVRIGIDGAGPNQVLALTPRGAVALNAGTHFTTFVVTPT
jgi:hypothetical protein